MHIKKLSAANHEDVIGLFGDERDNYHFIIDGLLKHNYRGHFNVYGEYHDEQLVSILLNNDNNLTYYSQSDRDINIYAELLKELEYTKLSGPAALMQKFLPYIEAKQITKSYLGVVNNIVGKRKLNCPVRII